ncbi:MAG: carboxylating nicotinate-nucleotide diphosphorylase [Bacteroidota bacterium]
MHRPSYLTESAISHFITSALGEDIGEGDHSSLGALPIDRLIKAKLLIKDNGVLAGCEIATIIFHQIDPSLQLEYFKQDGDEITKGDIVFIVTGSARAILSTERLVLNCMQRMSGIATYTRKLCKMIEGTTAQLMDTRKTTPNFRLLEKWAVAIGGGKNHRFALYDRVMLKDNHIDIAGGIPQAIENTKKYLASKNKSLKIEVETRSLSEVQQVLNAGGVDVIMLDNMSVIEMKKAVNLIGDRCKTEASGGITEDNLKEVAECGVDFISVGALTHSVKSLDLSLKYIS